MFRSSPGQGTTRAVCVALSLATAAFAAPRGTGGDVTADITAKVGLYEQSTRGVCGLLIVDLRDGTELADIRSRELFVPASNQKVLTSAFALASLGKDFRFATELYRVGDDLLLVGDGDPTLGHPSIAEGKGGSIYDRVDALAAAAAKEFAPNHAGDLLLSGRFDVQPNRNPDWPKAQYSRWYCAPVAALDFCNNCFDVTFDVEGGRSRATVLPESSFIHVENDTKVGRKHLWSLKAADDCSLVRLTGTVSRSTSEPLSVPVDDPPMLAGRVLAGRCRLAGLDIGGDVRKVALADVDMSRAKLLARIATPLPEVMRRCNKQSLNMAAECMFLRAGDGRWSGSATKMTETLVAKYGVDRGQIVVRDGGGLSKSNRVSPRAMAAVLDKLARGDAAQVFLASLPRSGTDGTLDDRMDAGPADSRVIAKTGYVDGASCLSGYVLDRDYRVAVAFSILVGKFRSGHAWQAKDLQDAVCRELVAYLDSQAATAPAR
jgi:D-alanyl-D-alanine carboxypeptidase/D-alanyl-D-alanine-endopeptidase (penicillin-binding protein 4)